MSAPLSQSEWFLVSVREVILDADDKVVEIEEATVVVATTATVVGCGLVLTQPGAIGPEP